LEKLREKACHFATDDDTGFCYINAEEMEMLNSRSLLNSIREFIVANPRNKIKPQPEHASPVPIFFENYPETLDKTHGVLVGNAPA